MATPAPPAAAGGLPVGPGAGDSLDDRPPRGARSSLVGRRRTEPALLLSGAVTDGRSTLSHLGVNALFLEPRMGGIETYVRELYPAIIEARPDLRISMFVNERGRELIAAEPWADGVRARDPPAARDPRRPGARGGAPAGRRGAAAPLSAPAQRRPHGAASAARPLGGDGRRRHLAAGARSGAPADADAVEVARDPGRATRSAADRDLGERPGRDRRGLPRSARPHRRDPARPRHRRRRGADRRGRAAGAPRPGIRPCRPRRLRVPGAQECRPARRGDAGDPGRVSRRRAGLARQLDAAAGRGADSGAGARSRRRRRLPRLGERRRSRGPLPCGGVLRAALAPGGLRPAGARGDATAACPSPARRPRLSRRSPEMRRCSSTRSGPTRSRRPSRRSSAIRPWPPSSPRRASGGRHSSPGVAPRRRRSRLSSARSREHPARPAVGDRAGVPPPHTVPAAPPPELRAAGIARSGAAPLRRERAPAEARDSRVPVPRLGVAIALRHHTGDVLVLDEIFSQLEYEPPRRGQAGCSRLSGAPRVVDLGANIGLFGAWVLGRYPDATIVAVEADPANAAVHRRTIEANELATAGSWSRGSRPRRAGSRPLRRRRACDLARRRRRGVDRRPDRRRLSGARRRGRGEDRHRGRRVGRSSPILASPLYVPACSCSSTTRRAARGQIRRRPPRRRCAVPGSRWSTAGASRNSAPGSSGR